MVDLMSTVIPEGGKVVLLGDGEFDGTAFQDRLRQLGWSYVCRTALSTTATWEGETFRLDVLARVSSQGGWLRYMRSMSPAKRMAQSWWCVVGPRGSEPLYLVSNSATSRGGMSLVSKCSVSRPFSQTTKAEGSICISRIYQTRSVFHGY